ncbi:uncharacterized protein PSFLO_02339 [Pseudozyma flocculosa]|uniref:Uncharacterized protein n=1 Tax=Pseudozyma flocculosa TaxID=84751 RepID=A0A5C3EXC4_9BASI|nr:uncharacterized protein PSFLO_02339 [Pseudozyma flocculosa]
MAEQRSTPQWQLLCACLLLACQEGEEEHERAGKRATTMRRLPLPPGSSPGPDAAAVASLDFQPPGWLCFRPAKQASGLEKGGPSTLDARPRPRPPMALGPTPYVRTHRSDPTYLPNGDKQSDRIWMRPMLSDGRNATYWLRLAYERLG